MILELFGFLLVICLALIIVGIVTPDLSALAIIGFFLMFLLSMIILFGGLEYRQGSSVNASYSTTLGVTHVSQTTTYNYAVYNDSTTHNMGFYLALAGAIGMIAMLVSLRRGRDA